MLRDTLTLVLIFLAAFGLGSLLTQVYTYLRAHGWAPDAADWVSRVTAGVRHDWQRDAHGCIDFDLLRLRFERQRTKGIAAIEVWVFGLGCYVACLVDRDEYRRYEAEMLEKAATMREHAKHAMAQMLREAAPPGMDIRVGDAGDLSAPLTPPVSMRDLEEDDDDDKGGGNVH